MRQKRTVRPRAATHNYAVQEAIRRAVATIAIEPTARRALDGVGDDEVDRPDLPCQEFRQFVPDAEEDPR